MHMTSLRPYSHKGMTLTELLVASILIGIVMLGIASFSVSMQHLQRSTSRSSVLQLRAKNALAQIVKDASLAVGDNQNCGKTNEGWANVDCGWGIRSYSPAGTRQSICFRHDRLKTPENYVDDTWVCYTHGSSYDIDRCDGMNKAKIPASGGAGTNCNDAASVKKILQIAKPEGNYYFNVIEDADGRLKHIELTLIIRPVYDQPAHPVNNPEIVLTTKVSPIGHSR